MSDPRALPLDVLGEAVAADPARPAVTFYDGASGERVELSVATLANWVAKTANLLVDDLGVGPGSTVALDLPAHWLGPVWLLAAWTAGAQVLLQEEPADVLVLPHDADPAGHPDAGDLVLVSLLPLAAPPPLPLPPGALDFAREVPAHGDRWSGPVPPPDSPALAVAGSRSTRGELRDRLPAPGDDARPALGRDDRVLSALPLGPGTTPGLLEAALLRPLAAGAGVVLVRSPERLGPEGLARVAAQERVRALAGLDPDGSAELAGLVRLA